MPRQKQYKPRALYFSPRLLESMEYIKEYPLTIVEAPSGFGKTTALNYFFDNSCFSDAYIYRITFLAAQTSGAWDDFCNLIGRVDEDCGKRLKNFGCPAQEDIGIIDGIIQDMDCEWETYIILDNFMDADFTFHRQLLDVLSRHNCQKLHFVAVITSVPGQRLRGLFDSRQIYRLRDSFLVFSQSDAAAYFREVGIRPAPEQLAQVWHSTEGWVFALYLQAIRWIEYGSFEQGDMDELIERSIWQRMDVIGQKFFLAISLTPEVTVAQASFMSGMASEEAFVLLSDNGIVHYNRERDNFYLQALLMSYLKKQFGYLDSGAQNNIYIRAGRWAQRTGNRLDSVRFYWAAKAFIFECYISPMRM